MSEKRDLRRQCLNDHLLRNGEMKTTERVAYMDGFDTAYNLQQLKLDKAMDYINDLADSGFEKARALKKEIEGMK